MKAGINPPAISIYGCAAAEAQGVGPFSYFSARLKNLQDPAKMSERDENLKLDRNGFGGSMTITNKGLHEEFTRFFESPSRESLRELLRRNFGESNQLDFKQMWPEAPKLARHILAMANSRGGVLIVGMAEKDDGSLDALGLSKIIDKVDISHGIEKFLPQQLKYLVLDFPFDSSEYANIQGKKFQAVIVEDLPEYIPFVSRAEAQGIRKAAIYVRRATASEEATYEELQELLNRRIETTYSSKGEFGLEKEIAELKILYTQIQRYRDRTISLSSSITSLLFEENPRYPKEDFEDFILRMIKLKKKRIENLTRTGSLD